MCAIWQAQQAAHLIILKTLAFQQSGNPGNPGNPAIQAIQISGKLMIQNHPHHGNLAIIQQCTNLAIQPGPAIQQSGNHPGGNLWQLHNCVLIIRNKFVKIIASILYIYIYIHYSITKVNKRIKRWNLMVITLHII